MKIGRREFLLSAGLSTLGFSPRALAAASEVPLAKRGVPIVQTLTDESSAQFIILSDPTRIPLYRARTVDGRELPLRLVSRTMNPYEKDEALDRLLVEGLWLGEDFYLDVYEGARPAKIDERIFRAFDTRPRASRFAVASCMADVLSAFQGPMWKAMVDTRPGAIFLIGDTCYADILTDGSLRGFWKRYVQTRKCLDNFRWKRLIPTYATWDDHDYGKGNGDKNYAMKEHTRVVFDAFWGWSERGAASRGPGVASAIELCGQRFFLMDDRYFRDPRKMTNGLHWGREQQEWLLNGLTSSSKPAWIMNGSQIYGGYLGVESFESDHPENLKDVVKTLASIEAPVLFGSGDVHFSEVMKIEKKQLGYETFELTSSSIHSATYPGEEGKNPRRLKKTWHLNFLIVDSYPDAKGGLTFKTWAVGAGQHAIFQVDGRVRRSSGGIAA